MCSKPKFYRSVLAGIRVQLRLSRKLKIFIFVRIELVGGLDYPWIPFSMTVAIWNLE